MYQLGPFTHDSAMANFKDARTLMGVLKNGERKADETFRQHL